MKAMISSLCLLIAAISLYLACFALLYEQGLLPKLISFGFGSIATLAAKHAFTDLASPVGHVHHPPSWSLRRFAELFFSKKTYTQVLEPGLSDMQKEHFEALAAGRLWKARLVLARGYWSFWSAVMAQLPISLIRRVYEVWKATKTGS